MDIITGLENLLDAAMHFFPCSQDYGPDSEQEIAIEEVEKQFGSRQRCCLDCDIEWMSDIDDLGECFNCKMPGKRGQVIDYCPHGTLKHIPYVKFDCAECSQRAI